MFVTLIHKMKAILNKPDVKVFKKGKTIKLADRNNADVLSLKLLKQFYEREREEKMPLR